MSIWLGSVGGCACVQGDAYAEQEACRMALAVSIGAYAKGSQRYSRCSTAPASVGASELPEVGFSANPVWLQGSSVLLVVCRKVGDVSVGLQDRGCSAALG